MIEGFFKTMMTETTPAVQVWMGWMGLVLTLSIVFMRGLSPLKWLFSSCLAQ